MRGLHWLGLVAALLALVLAQGVWHLRGRVEAERLREATLTRGETRLAEVQALLGRPAVWAAHLAGLPVKVACPRERLGQVRVIAAPQRGACAGQPTGPLLEDVWAGQTLRVALPGGGVLLARPLTVRSPQDPLQGTGGNTGGGKVEGVLVVQMPGVGGDAPPMPWWLWLAALVLGACTPLGTALAQARLGGALRALETRVEGLGRPSAEPSGGREGAMVGVGNPAGGEATAPLLRGLRARVLGAERRITRDMAALQSRLEERQALLAGMVEGVLAVDPEGKVLEINPSAARMFSVQGADARGRSLIEVVHHAELARFAARVGSMPATAPPLEAEFTLFNRAGQIVRALGTRLRGAGGQSLGALVMLHDISRLRQLENLRSEFVANVSHELKTPVTSIVGFVETLRDGAIDSPEEARRFLEIIGRQAGRLQEIIEDLLRLSRVEQEARQGLGALPMVPIAALLEEVADTYRVEAQRKGAEVRLICPRDLRAAIHRDMVREALENLVDNALRYTPDGTEIRILASEVHGNGDGAGWLELRVEDDGPGIPPAHHARIFERFYRTEEHRGRASGGTGLGLAIVKHIAQAHGGTAGVENAPGQGGGHGGAMFRLRFPLRAE